MNDELKAAFVAAAGGAGFAPGDEDASAYLTDWRGTKTGSAALILKPGKTAEVAAVIALANETATPVVTQGGNTGLVGGSVPEADGGAVLLNLSRMNAVRAVNSGSMTATVEAGVILQTLHETAAAEGMLFPLSLGAKGSATIGGLISTNAGGTQVLRYGTMRAQVLGLEAVMPDGSVLNQLTPLRKDNTGYDIKQLLIGAEGTLGVVTAASLRLVAAPDETATALAGLSSPEAALALLGQLQAATGGQVDSFELIPRIAVELVTAHVPGTRDPLAAAHDWYALIELTGGGGGEGVLRPLLEAELADAIEQSRVADAVIAESGQQRGDLWRLRETIAEAEKVDGVAIKFDISVPVGDMPGFIDRVGGAIERRWAGTSIFAFGHLGDGNIHFNVRSDIDVLTRAALMDLRPAITAFVYEELRARGGSISAEHGIGSLKADALARLGDPGKLAAMRAVKAALDPRGIMNPGKVLV
ncbi:MAG: FAD-binding oxidoreductase [Pacificimonas sp.]|jgi:FAD/FMN-containing dehydrogenase|nr:FAD-binding oxidoreductase [Pacificimonas sp.]